MNNDRKIGTTHLIAVGNVPAVKAEDLRKGDVVMFNWGYKNRVHSIKPVGKTKVCVYLHSDECIIEMIKSRMTAVAIVVK